MKFILVVFLFISMTACSRKNYNSLKNNSKVEDSFDIREEEPKNELKKFEVNDFKKKATSSEWLKSSEASSLATQWSLKVLKLIADKDGQYKNEVTDYEEFFLSSCKEQVRKCDYSRLELIKNDPYAIEVITYLS